MWLPPRRRNPGWISVPTWQEIQRSCSSSNTRAAPLVLIGVTQQGPGTILVLNPVQGGALGVFGAGVAVSQLPPHIRAALVGFLD